MKLGKIDTLLIDLDGTLVDMHGVFGTFDFLRLAFTFLRSKVGISRAFKILLRVHQVMTPQQTPLAIAGITNDQKAVRALAKSSRLSEEQARDLMAELLRQVFPKLERHFKPIPGAREFIEWATPRFKLILATNPVWPKEIITQRVHWAGVDPSHFSFISCAQSMHHMKPDRRYYEEILALNGLKAAQCLHIGNEIKMDFPATEAGIPVFILSHETKLRHLVRKRQKSPGFRGGYRVLQEFLTEHM